MYDPVGTYILQCSKDGIVWKTYLTAETLKYAQSMMQKWREAADAGLTAVRHLRIIQIIEQVSR